MVEDFRLKLQLLFVSEREGERERENERDRDKEPKDCNMLNKIIDIISLSELNLIYCTALEMENTEMSFSAIQFRRSPHTRSAV